MARITGSFYARVSRWLTYASRKQARTQRRSRRPIGSSATMANRWVSPTGVCCTDRAVGVQGWLA